MCYCVCRALKEARLGPRPFTKPVWCLTKDERRPLNFTRCMLGEKDKNCFVPAARRPGTEFFLLNRTTQLKVKMIPPFK